MSRIVTGKYTASSSAASGTAPTRVEQNTELTTIKALEIVEPISSIGDQGSLAYTTDQMQGIRPGMFVRLGMIQASGISFGDGGLFVITNPGLLRLGATYYWEARGD